MATSVVPPASGDETDDEARRSAPVAEKEDTDTSSEPSSESSGPASHSSV